MRISRHFVSVEGRRVHYRRAGYGPAVLLVHQSPRSSAEFLPLIARWAEHFTVIAPDTPGFGQSEPLPGEPEIGDFGAALLALLDTLRIERTGAYGFHSGGIILANAFAQAPQRFSALGIGGYAIWTEAERAAFGHAYLPPFRPSAYGEHLTWLWNRILEQSWFFPWFDTRPETRLSVAHDDPAKVDAVVCHMLDAGDAYRAGYGAVLRAPRDIPPAVAVTPPVLITAYDGDPLQPHIDRLGAMPAGWSARKVGTPAEQQAATLAFLQAHPAPDAPAPIEAADQGFVWVEGMQLHWRGRGSMLHVHAPGRSTETLNGKSGLGIDLPGHGLSDEWNGADWNTLIETARRELGAQEVVRDSAPAGEPDKLFPDLSPDRFGTYLTRAWQIVRARHLFAPWYEARAANALPFDPSALAPERLAVEHRELLRASAARDYMISMGEA
ncbi:alpha/beta fold hydrolase [Sphingomonas sp.]|uniref:alpha/beta fold hydrolase n=1 Tax=Sphingomonas sp. TaxID=28214 RepID=UPI002DF6FDB4|nr:alpha/beta fold hydrolase [Sphingomonas sp.]